MAVKLKLRIEYVVEKLEEEAYRKEEIGCVKLCMPIGEIALHLVIMSAESLLSCNISKSTPSPRDN